MGNDHVMAGNYVHDMVVHGADSGAFYSGRDWAYRGLTLRDNVFARIQSDSAPNPWFSVTAVRERARAELRWRAAAADSRH